MRILLFFLFFMQSVFATIEITPNTNILEDFKVGYYYDESGNQTIQNVVNQSFLSTKNRYTFGYKPGSYWFRFHINNNSNQSKYILSITEPYFQEVNFYIKKNGQYIEEKNGLQVLLEDKPYYHHKPFFSLDFSEDKEQVFYVKIRGKLTTTNEFSIMSSSYFNAIHDHKDDMLYMLFFGILVMISLLNLFIYYRLKEKMYLYYVLYIICYSIWLGLYSGLLLYTPIDGYFHESLICIPLFVMFLILFSIQFLNIKEYLPHLYRPLNYMGYLYLFFAVMVFIDMNPWYQITTYSVIVAFFIMMLVALYLLRQVNDSNIRWYIIIMSVYLLSLMILALMVNGFIENNDFTRYGFLYASVFEVLAFSFILTNRFYIFHKEKIISQSAVIETKTQSEAVLEERIKERTQEVVTLLEDKELILKELYHRVKNNFHNIVGILWIESQKSENSQIQQTCSKLISRIKSMSHIHQYLHENESLSTIDSKEYIENVMSALGNIYDDEDVKITKDIGSFALSINESNNLAIIINEVINNSVKYRDHEKPCHIYLSLNSHEGQAFLFISDNGSGFDATTTESGLGLSLIGQFSNALDESEYQFYNENGACFELKFKLENGDETSLTSS